MSTIKEIQDLHQSILVEFRDDLIEKDVHSIIPEFDDKKTYQQNFEILCDGLDIVARYQNVVPKLGINADDHNDPYIKKLDELKRVVVSYQQKIFANANNTCLLDVCIHQQLIIRDLLIRLSTVEKRLDFIVG